MKFARYLEETQTPEWKKAYIDYRGLKKRITAIRRDQPQNEPGSTPLLPLSPLPSTGAEGHTDSPASSYENNESTSNSPFHSGGNRSDEDYDRASQISPVQARSNTGTSTGIFPRLRRRSTAASAMIKSQVPGSHAASDNVQRNMKLPWTPGSHPPLQELLPLLAPVERAFFEMLDSELDKVESFFCARERELRARYDALKGQLQTLKDHRRAFHEAHPRGTTASTWLPFTLTLPISSALYRLSSLRDTSHKPHLASVRLGKQRKGSDDEDANDNRNDADDGGEEEKIIGEQNSLGPEDIQMSMFGPESKTGKGLTVETVQGVHSNVNRKGNSSHSTGVNRPRVYMQSDGSGSGDVAGKGPSNETEDAGKSNAGVLREPEDYREAKKTLKKAVQECYRGVEVLNNYRTLNLIGFRKALKKFEKVTHIPAQQAYTVERIEPSAFASAASLESILREMEELFAARFARGDKKKAQARLRGAQQKSHHFSTFRTGMLLGLAVPAVADGLYKSFQPETRAAIASWDGLLFVYGIFLVPVIFSLLIGVNLLVWHKARINYVFIFELDLRTRLDYREYFEVPALLLSTLCCAFWMSFARVGAESISPSSWPLIWLAWAMAVWLDPLPILFRSSRYWLLKNLSRQLTSGVRRVEFQDFWMGDQFCSLVFTLGDLWFVGCAYSHKLENWRECTTGKNWAPAFALAVIPFVVRFVQSIKRWVDSRLMTHLINAGKYGTGIIYYLTYYLWRAQGGGYGTRFVAWCVLGVCYATYAGAWDILMDWSLLRPHAKHRLLRSDVLYTSYIPLYYVAMVTNMVIRFEFLMYIPEQGVNYVIRTFIAAMLEMLRRWQWNFYRLENEHIGNMDQYRVTREVPLPYSFEDPSHESDGGDEDEDDVEDRVSTRSGSWHRGKISSTPVIDSVRGHSME